MDFSSFSLSDVKKMVEKTFSTTSNGPSRILKTSFINMYFPNGSLKQFVEAEGGYLGEEVLGGEGKDGLRIGGEVSSGEGVGGDDDGVEGEEGEERGTSARWIRRQSRIPLQRIRAGVPAVDSVGSSSSSASSRMMSRRVWPGILAAEEGMEIGDVGGRRNEADLAAERIFWGNGVGLVCEGLHIKPDLN
ncbi:hypothetical protein QJS10_CPB21g00400 [Acorus calamus]|uniref:Uncharacterized protein n=1 Tax=Acorus calamus TaxID=4465 RepID=A0AAV9C416_ACOCL|nr:hypothetical protein QJS10_CPB21g00400 [Acorus calamus]